MSTQAQGAVAPMLDQPADRGGQAQPMLIAQGSASATSRSAAACSTARSPR